MQKVSSLGAGATDTRVSVTLRFCNFWHICDVQEAYYTTMQKVSSFDADATDTRVSVTLRFCNFWLLQVVGDGFLFSLMSLNPNLDHFCRLSNN